MESAYEELEFCSVCFQHYNEGRNRPKLLPCMHTLCISCVESLDTKPVNKMQRSLSASSSSSEGGDQANKDKKCPFCRETFSRLPTALIQDNRYILVHLRHLKKLQEAPRNINPTQKLSPSQTSSEVSQASAPSKAEVYDEPLADDGNFSAAGISGGLEAPHHSVTVQQLLRAKKNFVLSSLTKLDSHVQAYSLSVKDMDTIMETVSSAMMTARSEFENIKKDMNSLQTQVKSLKDVCISTEIPTEAHLLNQYGNLIEEIRLSNDWLLNFMERMKSKTSIENLHSGKFEIDNKDLKISVATKPTKSFLEVTVKNV